MLKILSEAEQNKLARLYPFEFDLIPDHCPPDLSPFLFNAIPEQFPRQLLCNSVSDYTLEHEMRLNDYLNLKGYRHESENGHYSEYVNRASGETKYVIHAVWVIKKVEAQRSKENYRDRIEAGALAPGALGIVGNNLDKRNTKVKKETRAALFQAQNMLQKIRLDGEPIISEAVCGCGKPLGQTVQLQSSTRHGSASINNIQTCGSVWACPVCRQKIIQERADELKEIYEAWQSRGGHAYMLTLTTSHSKRDNLAELYGSNVQGTGLSAALGKFRASRHFAKDFKASAGYFGDVRGIEVTWGRANGFHPHIHMLILCENTINFASWKNRFFEAWYRACDSVGLKLPSYENGVQLSYCKDVGGATYLAKWSAASEVASQSMKSAKKNNFSITELERALWDSDFRSERKIGMTKAAEVLRSYYASMKGQRMLQTGGISKNHNWKAELIGQNESDSGNHRAIADLDYKIYIKIKRSGRLPALLEAAETIDKYTAPIDNIRGFLISNGYDYRGLHKPKMPVQQTVDIREGIGAWGIPVSCLGSVGRPPTEFR